MVTFHKKEVCLRTQRASGVAEIYQTVGFLAIESNPRNGKEIAIYVVCGLPLREKVIPVGDAESFFKFPCTSSVFRFKVRRKVGVPNVHVPKSQWRVSPVRARRKMMCRRLIRHGRGRKIKSVTVTVEYRSEDVVLVLRDRFFCHR